MEDTGNAGNGPCDQRFDTAYSSGIAQLDTAPRAARACLRVSNP